MGGKRAEMLFEVSFEVCNKVGGIWTVITSKAERIQEYYGNENYILIGPYFSKSALGEFDEHLPEGDMKKAFDELKNEGIVCHYGKWLTKGEPTVILIDFANYWYNADAIKGELWNNHKVDSLRGDHGYTEPLIWGYAAGKLIEKLVNIHQDKKCVAHFHEWLSGPGLLYLKSRDIRVATIFHTHATILGRTLASSEMDIYEMKQVAGKEMCAMELINPIDEAYKHNMESKYFVERRSAEVSDVFTTVSEITGMEAGFLLGKKPDIFLHNGLDIEKFPLFDELSIKHKMQRDRIREFLVSYFYPYYTFDLKDSLIYFIAGRNEFHDKGIDIYIKALGELNRKLKSSKSKAIKSVVAFIWVPGDVRSIKPELLANEVHYRDIKGHLEEHFQDIKRDLIYSVMSEDRVEHEHLIDKDLMLELKKKKMKFKRQGLPPLATHDMNNHNDIILSHLREAGLTNFEEEPVKVIFYPIYLSSTDGLLNMSYYEAMQGSHLGIFPSYYEPWGYTPLEAGALGVSSITTDLAGFGRFIQKHSEQNKERGIFVLNRFGKSEAEVTRDLSHVMYKFANLSQSERVANKMQSRNLAARADWSIMVNNYIKAYDMAMEKVFK